MGESEAEMVQECLKALNISTKINQDAGEILKKYEKAASSEAPICAQLEENLIEKFSTGISMATALSLALSFPTLVAIPDMFVNAYKNVLAISVATAYVYPQAEKVKEYLKGMEIPEKTLAGKPMNDIPSVFTAEIKSAMDERNFLTLSGSSSDTHSLVKARIDAAMGTLLPRVETPRGSLSLDTDDAALVRALLRKIVRPLFAEGKTPSFDDFANAIKKFVGQTTYLGSNPTPIADIVLHMGELLIMAEDLSAARNECHRDAVKNQVLKLDEEIARVKAELEGLETQTTSIHDRAAMLRTRGAERLERIKDLQRALCAHEAEYSSIQIDLSDCERGLQNIESLAAVRVMILSELETARGRMLIIADSAASQCELFDRGYQSHMERIRESCRDFDL